MRTIHREMKMPQWVLTSDKIVIKQINMAEI
jgi:hypothetical protein